MYWIIKRSTTSALLILPVLLLLLVLNEAAFAERRHIQIQGSKNENLLPIKEMLSLSTVTLLPEMHNCVPRLFGVHQKMHNKLARFRIPLNSNSILATSSSTSDKSLSATTKARLPLILSIVGGGEGHEDLKIFQFESLSEGLDIFHTRTTTRTITHVSHAPEMNIPAQHTITLVSDHTASLSAFLKYVTFEALEALDDDDDEEEETLIISVAASGATAAGSTSNIKVPKGIVIPKAGSALIVHLIDMIYTDMIIKGNDPYNGNITLRAETKELFLDFYPRFGFRKNDDDENKYAMTGTVAELYNHSKENLFNILFESRKTC